MPWLFQQKNVALGILNYSMHLLFQIPEDSWTGLQIFWEERRKQHFNKDLDQCKSSSFLVHDLRVNVCFVKAEKSETQFFTKIQKEISV